MATSNSFAQSSTCGMTASSSNSHDSSLGLLGNAALNFYEGNQGCASTEINVNFILLYRDDWTGNFDLNNSEESSFFWLMRQEFLQTIKGEISFMDSCNDDVNPNLVFNQEVFQINNTDAWDANGCDNFIPFGSPCFDDNNFCPDPYASVIESVITSIGGEKDINVYFPVEGIVWNDFANGLYLRTCVPDRINISPWLGRFPTTGDLGQFVISQIANVYPRYLNARDRPDCFPNNPNTIITELYTNMGRGLAHEVGHNFSLVHRDNCTKAVMHNNSCCANGYKYLNSEIAKINRSLSIKNIRNSRVDCNTNKNCYFTLPAGQTLHVDFDAWIDRNILIERGATLIVEKEMKMANEAMIDIESGGKLIVNGGTITSCDDTWKGIRVAGGNADFDVKIMNNALIENTSNHAVSMFPPNIPWPEVQNFGNGIIITENSTFLNCFALAGLVAFKPSSNKSRIKNCTHIGGKFGVTNWHSEGVIVDNCTFEDISEHCIGAYDGTYDLIDNHFYGGTQEVLFTNTKSGKISKIEGNTFFTAPIGLRSIGSHTGFLNIADNTFHSSEAGIAMELINHYEILDNIFIGQEKEGILCQRNGTNVENDINGNTFEGSEKGIIAALDNDRLSFLRNCFNTTDIDVEIYGLVALQMGGSSPAGNCFTHKGSVSSGIMDMNGSPTIRPNLDFSFIYNEPGDTYENCIDAVDAHGNIHINDIANSGPFEDFCNDDDPEEPDTPCEDTERNVTDLSQAIANLQIEILSIYESDLSEIQKQLEMYTPDRCLAQLKSQLYDLYLENESYAAAQEVYSPAQNFDDHIAVFSAILAENDLVKANQYLNDIPFSNEAEVDFEVIQKLNIERLTKGPFYTFPSTQLNGLLAISEKSNSYAGFAKSLYFQLTGELAPIQVNIPRESGEVFERSRDLIELKQKVFSAYPNPFSDALNLELNGYEDLSIRVTSISGNVIFEDEINGSYLSLNTKIWIPGIYIVQIHDDGEVVETNKIALLR